RPRTHGGAQSIDIGDYDAYQKNVRFITISESRVSRLGTQEQEERTKLDKARQEKELAKEVLSRMEVAQVEQRNALEKAYSTWRVTKTDQNFKALTALLTVMSTTVKNKIDVEFVSEDSHQNPTAGAQIKYETDL